jgi:MazG nucleotide pyrophosphohydrolase domain
MQITDLNVQEYHTLAPFIANDNIKYNLSYAIMGAADEAGELLEKIQDADVDPSEIKKELGDVLWHLNQTLFVLIPIASKEVLGDITVELFLPEAAFQWTTQTAAAAECMPGDGKALVSALIIATSKLTGTYKKLIRDSNYEKTKIIPDVFCGQLLNALMHCFSALGWIANSYLQTSVADVAACNLEKLFSRQIRGVIGGSGDNR